jgi:hypothetical protein
MASVSLKSDYNCSISVVSVYVDAGQAMEIGAPAICFLIDTWEGHLTPPEAVSIADRASRGCDLNIVRAAAELALSCLPHAHALNPNEIQRAILQVTYLCFYVKHVSRGLVGPKRRK